MWVKAKQYTMSSGYLENPLEDNMDEEESSVCSGEEEEEEEEEENCLETEMNSESVTDKDNHIVKGMSMEELLAVQEKVGVKVFAKKISSKENNLKSSVNEKFNSFKRANKNRPHEVPMLHRPAPKKRFVNSKTRPVSNISRDPRFDDLSGKLDITAWKNNYSFISEKRKNEKKLLKNELKAVKNSKDVVDIKKAIQRMENQEREIEKWNKEKQLKRQERESAIAALQVGKTPKFISRKDKSQVLKQSFMEQLKKENRVEKYLERKEKKLRTKELKLSRS